MDRIQGYIEAGKKEGANLACGGKRIDRKGYFMESTSFTDVQDDLKIAREEIFGPVLSVFKFKDIPEVVKRANDTQYGLASVVITKDMERAIELSNAI